MSNKERFSEAFRFQLSNTEFDLRSQIVILNEIGDVKSSATSLSKVAEKMQRLL